jgi:hypothetical protein
LLNDVGDDAARSENHSEVNLIWYFFDSGITFLAQDFGIVGVDGVDFSLVTSLGEDFHQIKGKISGVWVGSDNGYGLGFEEGP